MKMLNFAKRNLKEMLRDPLSYVFALILPVVLFALLNGIFYDPQTAFWFSTDMMFSGMLTFSYSFAMLFLTIQVSKDKSTAFLTRLYASPMKTTDFIGGYFTLGLVITFGQSIIIYFTAMIISAIREEVFLIGGNLLAVLAHIPTMLVFIALGVLFGSVFSDKSAPGITSAIITACGMFSGAWMPIESFYISAKGFHIFCRVLPFYPATLVGRLAGGLCDDTLARLTAIGFVFGKYDFIISMCTLCAYCALCVFLAIFFFRKGKLTDKK